MVYLQPAKEIASPLMYADCKFQLTQHAMRYSNLRHYTLSRYENKFK